MPRRTLLLVLPLLTAIVLPGVATRRVESQPQPQTLIFEEHVLPLLKAKCLSCHGDDKLRGDLDLRNRAAILEGGDNGPAIVPGSAKTSLLWKQVHADKMPPPGKEKLTAAEKDLLARWIDQGAKASQVDVVKRPNDDRQVTDADRQFWAFQPPRRPPVPAVKQNARVRNAIDAFLLASLEKHFLQFSPEANRVTLLRRLSFDLLGLPPTPQEIAEFQGDQRPDAYERLVDRLLASPHYGERWARHWLDVAGYADSEGILDADYVRSAAWRYRDYVIRAFNSDKPYDRFLKEQIAGDELVNYWQEYQTQKTLRPEVVEAVTATGFLRCASDTSRPDFVTIKNAPGYYYQTLDDTVKIVASATLGLTLHCAKCHSHKYDPIPQKDYYRIQAIFMSGYRPQQWVPQVQRRLSEATAAQEAEAKTHNAKLDSAIGEHKKQLQKLDQEFGDRLFNARLLAVPSVLRAEVRKAVNTPAAKRDDLHKLLAKTFEKWLRPDPAALAKLLADSFSAYRTRTQPHKDAVQTLEAKRVRFAEIRAFYDLPGEPKTPLLRRGDYLQPGPTVGPGTLAVLATPQPFQWQASAKDAKTSGRRLAFAQWLTQPDHPLTARVLVNRLWLHHFGVGLVATPENFGKMGGQPSHPELLDWLATELPARGWSVKALHRLIVTSSAYRQRSTVEPTQHAAAKKLDPDNRLLWRQRLRRLEAESLRDAVLRVSGALNGDMFGPPVPMVRKGDGEIITPADAGGQRRSIYLQVRRSQPLTFLQVFDQPVIETNCTRREVSTVSSQALTLLNSDFMVRQSAAFADRALKENAADPAARALLLAFGRSATEAERARLTKFVERQTQVHLQGLAKGQQAEARRRAVTDLCHMLLSANEFAYVD